MNEKVPFSTSDNVDSPVSLYAATKKSNELMAHCYTHLYGFPSTGLRFFTVYGPRGRPDMAYFSFTNRIVKGEPIKIFNNGDMWRDFTYIDDVVAGILNILPNPSVQGLQHRQQQARADHGLFRSIGESFGNDCQEGIPSHAAR
jgi:UDP-glucuronate 4-epimerase